MSLCKAVARKRRKEILGLRTEEFVLMGKGEGLLRSFPFFPLAAFLNLKLKNNPGTAFKKLLISKLL